MLFLSSGRPKELLPEGSRRLATCFRLLLPGARLQEVSAWLKGGGDASLVRHTSFPISRSVFWPPSCSLARMLGVRGQGVRSEVSTMGLLEKSVQEG